MRQILLVWPLFLGSFFLLFAGGVNSLILPIRGEFEGFSTFSLGLLGTAWAAGYILGCIFTVKMVASVGHVRTFGVMCAFAAIAILSTLLLMSPLAWLPMRAVSGFCFAGAAMIVESWLNEQSEPSSRGKVFGVYTMINLFGTTLGQLAVPLGDTHGYLFFVLGAVVYCLALVPTALSTVSSPKPLTSIKLNVPALWQNSPVAVAACFFVGVSNSAFGTLAAIYAKGAGLTLGNIALFASIPILAGGLAQIPIGALSDRVDRRFVLLAVTLIAISMDATFLTLAPTDPLTLLTAAAIFGTAIFTLYPIIVAHASDHATPGTFIQVSGGLLLVYGCGAIFGPLIAGTLMSIFGSKGLFFTTCASHMSIVLFILMRLRCRAAVDPALKRHYETSPIAPNTTPETATFSAEEGENMPLVTTPPDESG